MVRNAPPRASSLPDPEGAAAGRAAGAGIAPVKIGYARVSTAEQSLDLQRDALERAGCERIIVDTLSGVASVRPGLEKVREQLRRDDVLVVWRLDRLGRSLKDLIAWATWLDEQGVALVSLHETIDTASPTGTLIFHMFGALAEFERNLIRERTQAGLAAARARGRHGGRPPALDADKRALAVRLYEERKLPVHRICKMMGISKPTLYGYIQAANAAAGRRLPPAPDPDTQSPQKPAR